MRLMLAGAARLVSSGYAGAVGVRAAPGAPGAPSSGGRPPGYGVWLTALRMSSLWSANSAQTITMIAMVTMPVIADTAPCMPVVARLAVVAKRNRACRVCAAVGQLVGDCRRAHNRCVCTEVTGPGRKQDCVTDRLRAPIVPGGCQHLRYPTSRSHRSVVARGSGKVASRLVSPRRVLDRAVRTHASGIGGLGWGIAAALAVLRVATAQVRFGGATVRSRHCGAPGTTARTTRRPGPKRGRHH